MSSSKEETYLILDNIRSIHNVGAMFRTADAAGVSKIFLCGITAYPSQKDIKLYDQIKTENPIQISEQGIEITYTPSKHCFAKSLESRISKTALKSLGHIEFEYRKTVEEIVEELKKSKLNIVALEQSESSIDYRKYTYSKPFALVVGNEVSGISPEIIELCDTIVEIPMQGASKSLNVATATGIVLFKAIE